MSQCGYQNQTAFILRMFNQNGGAVQNGETIARQIHPGEFYSMTGRPRDPLSG